MITEWLGRIGYTAALELQERLAAGRRAAANEDHLLLLEHDPVYTIGRTPDQSSLGAAMLPHPVVRINRGGQATYHGPGQLVGYPILDLRERGQDLHAYLRSLESILIALLAAYRIEACRREGLTGVWVEDRKIASIGVGIRHWVTMHGFALNVSGDLTPFSHITPCGIAGVRITSISAETGREVTPEHAASVLAGLWEKRFDLLLPPSALLQP